MAARAISIFGGMLLLASLSSTGRAQDFEGFFQRGVAYQNAGQFQNAAPAYEAALRVGGPGEVNYESAQANLAMVYGQLRQYDRAEALFKHVIANHEARQGADDTLGKILGDLGTVYGGQGKFQECYDCMLRAIKIRSSYHPIESLDVLLLRQYLIATVAQAGEMELAGELASGLLKELEARVGPNDHRLRFSLFKIANTMVFFGNYRTADEMIQRARRLPPENLRALSGGEIEAINIAALYMEMGRFIEAMEQYNIAEKAVILRIPNNPSYRPVLTAVQGAQAECLMEMGQPERALKLLIACVKETTDLKAFSASALLYNLGLAYERVGQLESAEAVYRQVIVTETFHISNRVSASRHLAGILASQGKSVEAEKLLDAEKGLETRKEHSLTASAYLAAGRSADAETEFRAAIQQLTQDERQFPRKEAACWLGLAQALDAQQKLPAALEALDKSRHLLHQLTVGMLPVFPEPEQQTFLANEEEPAMQKALALVCQHVDSPRAVELSAAWLLNRKGLAQQALADRMLLAREADDPALAALVNDWFSIRHRLAKLTVGEGSDSAGSPELTKQIEQLTQREQELARSLGQAKVRQATTTPWYTLPQFRESLPASAIYIDLVRFVPPAGPDQAEYLAWLVPPENKGNVQLVNLGKASEIDEAVAAASRQLQKPPEDDAAKEKAAAAEPLQRALKQLSGRLLKPLWSSLAKFDHWIICPDGTPWLVPWSALIIPEKEKENDHNPYVVEKYRVSLVTNGRDLIEKPTAVSGNPPLMFANPDFDLLDSNIAASSLADRQVWFNRGAKSRSADISTNWSRLAGTAQEAQLVAPVLQKYVQHAPQLLQGAEATEAAFKAAWRPRVVLLSTHGFFLPAPIIASTSPVNPLLRCGLVLSGANRLELRLQQNHDDGIVTGLEVLSTDLRGTELVVLSACETGLGELYAGEGVAGLRQAFQLAGARSVVATLWQIPDQETAWLMNFFFEKLAAGADKAAALQEAQKTLLLTARKNGESAAHPYYWAAFTMTGDWRVSDVGPATPRPDRPAPLPLVEVTVEYARVMDGAKVATHVRLGERLPRGQQNGEWVQVYYEPGSKRSGWIPRNQVRDVR